MMSSVNRIFLRRSGILNALMNALSIVFPPLWRGRLVYPVAPGLPQDLNPPAGLLDLLPGRPGEAVGLHGERTVELAAAQDLDRQAAPDQAGVGHGLGGHRGSLVEPPGQALHVDHRPFHPVPIGEPRLLGDPAGERHLAALVPDLLRVPGQVALGPPADGLALAGGPPPTGPPALAGRSGSRAPGVELHSTPSPPTTCRT